MSQYTKDLPILKVCQCSWWHRAQVMAELPNISEFLDLNSRDEG